MKEKFLTRREAIEFCDIPDKHFDNYAFFSKEIKAVKKNGRWYFSKSDLKEWKRMKKKRTVKLTLREYQKCFQFAIKLTYGGLARHGIRGERSEVQTVDDVILGILAEYALRKFLKNKFKTRIVLDTKVHPGKITPPDIIGVRKGSRIRKPRIFVGLKSSKSKSAFLIADEHGIPGRSADVYIFARVWLPSDHLFRILRGHSFFKEVTNFLERRRGFRKIEKLEKVDVWICGYVKGINLDRRRKIPGMEPFKKLKYVKSVANLKNSDVDWNKFAKII
jgi:hypothetical protein